MTIVLYFINLCKFQIVEEQFKEYKVFHLGFVSFSDASNGMSVTFDSTPGWLIDFRDINYTEVSTSSNMCNNCNKLIHYNF